MDTLRVVHVDLVITDLFVSETGKKMTNDGVKLVNSMRITCFHENEKDLSCIPTIAISAAPDVLGLDQGLRILKNTGADATLPKPIDLTVLRKTIGELLRTLLA